MKRASAIYTKRYAMINLRASIKDVKIEIDKELGLPIGLTDLEKWKEIKENFLKPINLYKEHSSFREWKSEDRKYLQTMTLMDFGQNIPNLNRIERPEESFASYEEVDAYAEKTLDDIVVIKKYGKKTRLDSSSQIINDLCYYLSHTALKTRIKFSPRILKISLSE